MATVTDPRGFTLQNILFATDFSTCSQSALCHALALARHSGANLYVVNVLLQAPYVGDVPMHPEQTKCFVEQQLRDLVASESFGGIQHKELIGEGKVPRVLSELVHKYGIDLIVIGTEGHTGLRKFWLGSVAEEVFRTAECPVFTVGPHTTLESRDANLRNILYATDFGAESINALRYALSLTEENKARLTLLHVARQPLPEPNPWLVPLIDPEEVIAASEKKLCALMAEAGQLWHKPEYLVEFGSPVETILRTAAQNIDLIVLGVHRPKPWTKHFGAGVAYQLVCHAPCPVLSVGVR